MYNLFTFHSTHLALFTEKAVEAAGYPIKIIPVPRSISSSCGLAARIDAKDLNAVLAEVKKAGIELEEIYAMEENGALELIKKPK